jgi:hypothetical protein
MHKIVFILMSLIFILGCKIQSSHSNKIENGFYFYLTDAHEGIQVRDQLTHRKVSVDSIPIFTKDDFKSVTGGKSKDKFGKEHTWVKFEFNSNGIEQSEIFNENPNDMFKLVFVYKEEVIHIFYLGKMFINNNSFIVTFNTKTKNEVFRIAESFKSKP